MFFSNHNFFDAKLFGLKFSVILAIVGYYCLHKYFGKTRKNVQLSVQILFPKLLVLDELRSESNLFFPRSDDNLFYVYESGSSSLFHLISG